MDDKTLVERQMVAGDIHAGTYADLNRQIAALQSRIEALEAALRDAAKAERDRLLELREELRVLMLKQPRTDDRSTYSDGFANGICYAIEKIDALESKS